ncbi:multidrug efflux pump subunit AcrB [Anaerosolibacter carboniphilus]|uniref:Multidrug efflux pump subunit AcrB n=2 Tax=Anaerosolibacter carboniphilus TaxID=1417629 RepID=A0A841L2A7_9FIRM|nr:multidrug efflux pump subunit AcrB [Anaerosolibacter carboniphilus]
MGYPVGFMALLGAISLMGVVVNNGIVLLDYIKLLVEEYEDMQKAIVEAFVFINIYSLYKPNRIKN